MTAARSLAQQLARGSTSGDTDAAHVIVEELDRVEERVAALLRFSRREEFRFGPVDLGALARAVLGPLGPRLEAARIHIELDAPDGIVARADGEKMRQVIVNLVENALEALREVDEPRSLVVVVSGENGTARLQVGDTGPGVPAEALPRLFEPFFSLKPTGTGLGLAIAKRTIDAHGGWITATGSSGGGLRVEVELPLASGS